MKLKLISLAYLNLKFIYGNSEENGEHYIIARSTDAWSQPSTVVRRRRLRCSWSELKHEVECDGTRTEPRPRSQQKISTIVPQPSQNGVCFFVDKHSSRSASKPLQVIHHLRPERLNILSLYKPFVAGQVLLVQQNALSKDYARASNGTTVVRLCIEPSATLDYPLRTPFFYHSCISDILNNILAYRAGSTCTTLVPVSGILYHHMDMWVHPQRLLQTFDLRKVWLLEQGLRHRRQFCLEGRTLDRLKAFHKHERDGRVRALLALKNMKLDGLLKAWPERKICNTHADLWYLPSNLFLPFTKVQPYFQDVFHEVGIPTILMVVLAEAKTPTAHLNPKCVGGCCSDIPPKLESFVCGHRVDLTIKAHQNAMIQVLKTAAVAMIESNAASPKIEAAPTTILRAKT